MPIPQPPIALVPGDFLFCRRPGPSSYEGINSAQHAPCTSEEPIVGIALVSSSMVTNKGKEANEPLTISSRLPTSTVRNIHAHRDFRPHHCVSNQLTSTAL